MYKIALCDDDRRYINIVEDIVRRYCLKNNILIEIEIFDDSDKLAENIEENKTHDAYILDVEMPNLSGVELSHLIRERAKNAYIIFLTAHNQYAIDACGINVIKYIIKERMEKELFNALNQLFTRLDKMKKEKTYVICNKRKYIKILQSEIIYVYKKQKNAVFVLEHVEDEWERATLQEVYQTLDNCDMYMLDRGIILNISHIRKILPDKVIMDGGVELTSSKLRINDLKEYLVSQIGEWIL